MAWVKFGKSRLFNTKSITDFDRFGGQLFAYSGFDRLVNLTKHGFDEESALKAIQDAEREERRLMFEENKDEIVAAVSADVVEKMTAKNRELLAEMAQDMVEQIVSRTHLAKPSTKPSRIRTAKPKRGS